MTILYILLLSIVIKYIVATYNNIDHTLDYLDTKVLLIMFNRVLKSVKKS